MPSFLNEKNFKKSQLLLSLVVLLGIVGEAPAVTKYCPKPVANQQGEWVLPGGQWGWGSGLTPPPGTRAPSGWTLISIAWNWPPKSISIACQNQNKAVWPYGYQSRGESLSGSCSVGGKPLPKGFPGWVSCTGDSQDCPVVCTR